MSDPDSSTSMKWHCQGDPNDHHAVIQCAPDKIPQLAPNQVCRNAARNKRDG